MYWIQDTRRNQPPILWDTRRNQPPILDIPILQDVHTHNAALAASTGLLQSEVWRLTTRILWPDLLNARASMISKKYSVCKLMLPNFKWKCWGKSEPLHRVRSERSLIRLRQTQDVKLWNSTKQTFQLATPEGWSEALNACCTRDSHRASKVPYQKQRPNINGVSNSAHT